MGLLHPTPGEVIDRLCILWLKVEHCNGDIRSNFVKEIKELNEYKIMQFTLASSFVDLVKDLELSLGTIHRKLWSLEDNRRSLMAPIQQDLIEIASNAVTTTHLNDQRARLIKEINKLYGFDVTEKLYDQPEGGSRC